jgi:hypothetical protein
MFLAAMSPSSFRVLLLGASAFLLYGAGRLVMGSIPARSDRPGLRALLGTAMVTVVALVAIVMGRAELGLHVPIACSTAAITFGIASLILGRPKPTGVTGNTSWALLVPAVAIAVAGGFVGRLDAPLLAALAIYGVVATASWREPSADDGASPEAATGGIQSRVLASILWLGGIALAGLAAVLLMLGIPALEAAGVRADALAVAFLLAPAVVVPIFFELLPPGRPLGWNRSTSVLVKFALLNLCFALPIASLVQADVNVIHNLWVQKVAAMTAASDQDLTEPTTQAATAPTTMLVLPNTTMPAATQPTDEAAMTPAAKLIFPAMPSIALRVDLLVLAGAMLLLIPLAAGWHRPGGLEAAALLACYLLALMLTMLSTLRR